MKPKPAESRHWFQTSTVLRSRQLRWVLGGLGVLLVGATVGWAANEVFSPPTDAFDSTSYSLAEVISGEVGSSISLNVVAEWTPSHAGTNLATGTVTKISIQPGDEVTQGTILYSVNLRPVSIAQGETPAFRPLARGTTGEDVGQLQGMLAALGYYSGPVDGKFLGSTQVAVRAWQKGRSKSQQ